MTMASIKERMKSGTATYEEVSIVSDALELRIEALKKERKAYLREIDEIKEMQPCLIRINKLDEIKDNRRKISSLEAKEDLLFRKETRLSAVRGSFVHYLSRF